MFSLQTSVSFCILVYEFQFQFLLYFLAARVNGLACKNPAMVNDFFFSGLNITGNTSNPVGYRVTPDVTVAQLPGLHPWHLNGAHRLCTMGVSTLPTLTPEPPRSLQF